MTPISGARARRALVIALVAVVLLAPIPKMMTATATSMEEGSLLEYPTLALHGKVPTKAYWTEYGPLNVWVPAGAYAVAGSSVVTERLVGLAYRALFLAALYSLLRRHSKRGAVIGVVISWIILAPFGAIAYSWIGGLACLLAGLALLTAALARERPPLLMLLGSGLALGAAISFRPDMVVGVAVGGLILLWRRWRRLPAVLGGVAVGLLPLAALVALAGMSNVWNNLVVDPLIHLRAGRHLPVPPPTNEVAEFFTRIEAWTSTASRWPGPAPAVQLASLFWVLIGAALLLGISLWIGRRRPDARSWAALVAVSLLLFPQLVQRCDLNHMRFVGCLWLAMAPVAVAIVAGATERQSDRIMDVSAIAVLVTLMLAAPFFQVQAFVNLLPGFGPPIGPAGAAVHSKGRTLPAQSERQAREISAALAQLDAVSRPGERFFQGPADLSKTNYSETWMYWLEPDLVPSTYYLEMNPGISNARGSGLAAQVDSADVALLSTRYAAFSEPNSSVTPGNPAPNVVVERHFCLVARSGFSSILRHLAAGRSVDPARLDPSQRRRVGTHPEALCSALRR